MARKPRIDTVAGAVSVASRAGAVIEPPADVVLIRGAEPHFRRAIAAKPVSKWVDEAVAFAASYANHMAMMFRLQLVHDQLDDADLAKQEAKDLRTALHGAASMAKQARQSLGLHDRGVSGEKRDADKSDRIAREVEAGLLDARANELMTRRFN